MKRWAAVACMILATSCAGDDSEEPALGERSGCDPLDPSVCALPWPSSYFQEDADTDSGKQLAFGPTALPENRDFVQTRPDAFNELDGYSTMTPMIVWLGDVDESQLVSHLDIDASLADSATTVVLDSVTGERVPHFAEIDKSGEREGQAVLSIRPVVPLAFARRYVVAVQGLNRPDGSPIPATEAFAALRDGTETTDADVEYRRDRFEDEVFTPLEQAGVARDQLVVAWDFTTISEHSSLGRMKWMRDDTVDFIDSEGLAYTIDSVEDGDCTADGEHIARTVYGHFTSPLYTDIDGPTAVLTRDDDGMPFRNGTTEVDFMVRIPCSLAEDPGEGGMILQYGHGLLGDYGEARGGYLSEMIDENRWVLFAQNWTGMSEEDAGYITLMMTFDISDFHMIPERTMQGFTEWVAGLRLVRGALASDPNLMYDGSSVVDGERFAYYGNSQGAILGGAYFALSPDLEHGVLGVGGMPYSLLLNRSSDFDPFFLLFKNKFDDDREIALILAAIQTLWDPGESGGYAHHIVEPMEGSPDKEVLMQVAIGDSQVTTLGAHIAARAWDASTVAPAVRPIWGVDEAQAPFTGNALVEWQYSDGAVEPVENLPPDSSGDTHECPRREPEAIAQLVDFVEGRGVSQYCDGPCTSTRAGLCD